MSAHVAESFDAIVIGTGQSGPSLAARLAKAGRRTAIIERERFGGTCVNVGCIPTKALVASARAAHMARRGADFGVQLPGPVSVDPAAVKARKDAIVKQSNEGVTNWLEGTDGLTVIRGHARFTGAHTVAVDGRTLEAPQVFINVGARAVVPPVPGVEAIDALTNASMMELDTLPEHLLIVGGSYIGLEFGQMYRRFGSRVTVIEMGERLIPRDDADVSTAVQEILAAEGVSFEMETRLAGLERRDGQVVAKLEGPGGDKEVAGSHLLFAVGRRPNTDDLGLEAAGIETDERGFIRVDSQLRTTVDGVWAMGDCNGRGAFTHTSYNDFEIVAGNLLDGDARSLEDRIECYALYVDPPLGRVGMTEQAVRESGRPALIGKMAMSRVGRARERSETQGFMKVLVDAETKRLLGASILGIGGDEVVHALITLMYADAPYTVMQRAVHIHPTVSELLPTLLGDLRPLE